MLNSSIVSYRIVLYNFDLLSDLVQVFIESLQNSRYNLMA